MAHGVHDEHPEREHDDEQQVPEGASCSYVPAHVHHGPPYPTVPKRRRPCRAGAGIRTAS